ncbi:hypothetical protein BI350_03635 [Sporosarcina ureilytica]|uniref:Uncharacterized protein n=1 Tax=Sporosarcina ureilytica TaxID=298596 RepID=A0A1D8JDK4_9BACL|nr:hypothetical protein BI350_03635 [Sporosarcina ureilytica]
MKADAVFEGGGARGIAFIAAIQAMEEQNVEWESLAGGNISWSVDNDIRPKVDKRGVVLIELN